MTSKQIRNNRIKAGLTQAELAAELGVDVKTVNRWENNRTPAPVMALKLMDMIFFSKKVKKMPMTY